MAGLGYVKATTGATSPDHPPFGSRKTKQCSDLCRISRSNVISDALPNNKYGVFRSAIGIGLPRSRLFQPKVPASEDGLETPQNTRTYWSTIYHGWNILLGSVPLIKASTYASLTPL